MIIQNRVNGPSYSTDAVAHDVARYAAQRRALPGYEGPRAGATDVPLSLQDLYPSLFEVPARPFYAIALTELLNRISSIVSFVKGRRGARPAITGLAIALTLAAVEQASADAPVFGTGHGHSADAQSAYSMALGEATDALADGCPSGPTSSTAVIEATTKWNGREFKSTVRLSALCG